MKNITVKELVDVLSKLDQDKEIGIDDADTGWFMEIEGISITTSQKKRRYIIRPYGYTGDCADHGKDKSVFDFNNEEE